MDKMSYLIVSPVRAGSTWLNMALAKHYNLYNAAETLCKVTPALDGTKYDSSKDNFSIMKDTINKMLNYHNASDQYRQNMVIMSSEKIRELDRSGQIDYIKNQGPSIAKFTPWDLYEDDTRSHPGGWGFSLEKLQKEWAPLTTIFLYRKNIVEHFLSFLAYHRTGIGNATSQFMHYQRPKDPWGDDWKQYYAIHYEIMNKCYKEHKFDYTIAYEDLFKMDELCGVPLKDYHGQFTFKLNKYTREEKDEVIRRTGYSENYELH
jgi:hypothetical protein